MLQRGAPDITDKCKAAGTPTTPPDDVRKYLEICDLLDYRDGYRTDPITGQKEIVKRFHAPSGSYIPDAFPSLSAAYEDRMIRDGVYEKKIREAFSKGGQAMAEAAARRSSAAAEMGNAGGASPRDAGLKMSPEQAREIIDTVDEVAAVRLKRSGDASLLKKLNEAMVTLGMDPVDE
jgi:hypothetical protein